MTLDSTDIFCGAGGSSSGLAAAGLTLTLTANHWDRAVATHAANFPDADHLIADVSNYDMRRLPRTQVGWFSPECTWHSPAGGRRQASRARAQLDMFDDYVPTDAGIRSRATAYDVIRAAEAQHYRVLIVENVVEFVAWDMFDWWLAGLRNLGYTVQLISVNAAHVGSPGNSPAPQWRDRLYVFATGKGVPVPDARPKPLAWCPTCDQVTAAVQSWRHPERRQVGKYRQQYDYRCPNIACKHTLVEPFVLPASRVIDWANIGTRIGDRTRPLAPATMRRIQTGLDQFACPAMVTVTHPSQTAHGGRAYPAHLAPLAPLPTRTVRTGDGLACPPLMVPASGGWNDTCTSTQNPLRTRITRDIEGVLTPEAFITMLRRNGSTDGLDGPLATLAAARHHGRTVPAGAFVHTHHGGLDYAAIGHMTNPVSDPLCTTVARTNVSLVIPYRKARTVTTEVPLLTQATVESAALATPAVGNVDMVEIDHCHFRMLTPRESARAQRFHDDYVITGNSGEQQMQAGNAVASNVAQWLGGITVDVLS